MSETIYTSSAGATLKGLIAHEYTKIFFENMKGYFYVHLVSNCKNLSWNCLIIIVCFFLQEMSVVQVLMCKCNLFYGDLFQQSMHHQMIDI